jgi:prepilin-type N-terminal cleavage/methylation domain-containing protein/prepilin-type processing-associated H-X9-DG protein
MILYKRNKKTYGFTLTELLITMTVAATLGCATIPLGSHLILKANMEVDKQRMQQLALSYSTAILEGSCDLLDAKDMLSTARVLSELGYVNNVTFYQSSKRKSSVQASRGDKFNNCKDEDFDFLIVCRDKLQQHIQSCAIDNSMPICYSRGLQRDGTWSKESIYGINGGLIAFADGHVEKFTNKVPNCVLDRIF